jgi:hypothetical protein
MVDINPYVRVPVPIVRKLHQDSGKARGPIPVTGKLQGKPFSATVVRFRGLWRLYLNIPMRRAASVDVGDKVTVEVRLDPTSRIEPSPRKFTLALSKDKQAGAAFQKLAPYRRKEILRYLNGLKRPETVERNVGKIIRFLQGKEVGGLAVVRGPRRS